MSEVTYIPPLAQKKRIVKASYRLQWQRRDDPFWLPALLYVYLAAALIYLLVRTSLVNWHIWYGPLLYAAEVYGLFTTVLFLIVAQKIYLPIHRPSQSRQPVDILIPTYSEPLSVLEPVVIGALKIRGVRSVLVLDDGNRAAVKAMARRLKVQYHPRTTNKHAKAGNLNNGLQYTDAEFVVLLDADHIPLPNFIERTLGYFDDPTVAVVQSPQTFYNTSSFLFRSRHGQRAGWSEQMMFYDCIQPAKNRWNAAFFVGTSAMLRRTALNSVNGFATGTATEDIHTSLRLHAKGWQSVFLPEVLAYGLEAESLKEFYKQRKRWAAGSLGLLFRSSDSPLRARGLTFMQRLNYLSATLAHLQGVQKLSFFIVPIAAMLYGVAPLQGVNLGEYSIGFAAYLALSLGCTWAYSRGTYHPLYNEAYSLANMMAHFGGIKGVIKVQKKFAVSRKTATRKERTWLTIILWTLATLGLIGIARDSWLYVAEHKHYAIILYTLVFMVINLGILLSFLLYLRAYERKQLVSDGYAELKPLDKYRTIIGTLHGLLPGKASPTSE